MTLVDNPADNGLIKDGTIDTFLVDVVEASNNGPVLVDFWAEWCGPCKTLTPMLEKAVTAAGGAVKLVKINADENQELASQLRIQSLPTVLAFKDGQPVDGFSGALPESEIATFIAKLGGEADVPGIQDYLDKAAQLFEAGEIKAALELYGQIGQNDPSNLAAVGGLARCMIKLGQNDKAKQILDMVPPDKKNDKALAGAIAALELAEKAPADDALQALREKADKNPTNNQAAYDLAEAQFASGFEDEAASALLSIIRRKRDWNNDAARKLLVKMFEAAGHAAPFTVENRKRLSSILFS